MKKKIPKANSDGWYRGVAGQVQRMISEKLVNGCKEETSRLTPDISHRDFRSLRFSFVFSFDERAL